MRASCAHNALTRVKASNYFLQMGLPFAEGDAPEAHGQVCDFFELRCLIHLCGSS
jgi:hypothetical protein